MGIPSPRTSRAPPRLARFHRGPCGPAGVVVYETDTEWGMPETRKWEDGNCSVGYQGHDIFFLMGACLRKVVRCVYMWADRGDSHLGGCLCAKVERIHIENRTRGAM